MYNSVILDLSYLLAAIGFVYGLKLLSRPETARRGNLWAGTGMVLAMLTTMLFIKDTGGKPIATLNIVVILLVIATGSIAGTVIAKRVKMTAMPQLVSFFNASGGIASALVALSEYSNPENQSALVTLAGMTIGSIAFSGSLIAYGKLEGKIKDFNATISKYLNIFMLTVIVTGIILLLVVPALNNPIFLYVLFSISVLYGVIFVMPIGGADMPVVISLLNSLTGIAAAMAGFIYDNHAMILGGILVGAAGIILTILMTRAMNRSLLNVIIGGFGGSKAIGNQQVLGMIREIPLSDAAIMMNYSRKIVIIPGYGLAVASAQHVCSELDKFLSERGVEVTYAIHPVAGRMPGHMNVLLAEANVPYEKLKEMDEVNPVMESMDIAIVVGANDVVNPAALNDPLSPIYGMPIINAHKAKNIIVMKRGMGKGYAAIENMLFYNDKTRMLFGNAKDTLQKLLSEVKNL